MDAPELDSLLTRRVVLDTNSPMVYIGTLERFAAAGYWLVDADVHDRSDGHSTKEVYISEVHAFEQSGVRRANRRRVFVERHAVMSISALDDIVTDDGDNAERTPDAP